MVNPKKDKLRVILDTSVIISANYRSEGFSSPSIIWQAFLNEAFTLVISSQIIQEIISSAIKLNFQIDKIINVIQLINDKAEQIAGDYSTDYLDIIDPKDNMFLALAYESKADYLVSLDKKHILPIKYFYGTQILNTELFVRILSNL